MIYRELGRTGLKVSQLGFGAMRLPTVGSGKDALINRELSTPMFHKAFEAGVNYVDSAVFYTNGDSQRAVGDALKGWRDKIIVSTKNHYYGEVEAEWWQNLEDSLERLQVECIDLYNCHAMNSKDYEGAYVPRVKGWIRKAKDQGLIKRICCSFHDNNEALMKIVDTGEFETVTLQYNLLDRQLEEGIVYAHEKGMGVVVMGPVAGGRLGVSTEALAKMVPGVERVPELALRFVLANQNVSLALSGMSTMEQVEENLSITSDSRKLSAEDLAAIDEHLAKLKAMADLYCSGCEYCMPCPNEVRIPKIFGQYNQGRVYGLWKSSREEYDGIGKSEWSPGNNAEACTECGVCEEKCPQKLPIMKQLKEAHEALKKQ